MFELSVALKYLIPRWRQLSVSIISLISIIVIALVVWLIVVFFSVTHGLEKGWVNKLIALTAPIRITPKEEYFQSYYYLVDSISQDSGYTTKTIGEKLASHKTDPYHSEYDQEIPPEWPLPDLDDNGQLKDPVKLAFRAISQVKGASASEYETALTSLKLKMARSESRSLIDDPEDDSRYLSQTIYLSNFDRSNPNLSKIMIPVDQFDINNLIRTAVNPFRNEKQKSQLSQQILGAVVPDTVTTLKGGFLINHEALPANCQFKVCVLNSGSLIHAIYLPQSDNQIDSSFGSIAFLERKDGNITLAINEGYPIPLDEWTPLYLMGGSMGSVLNQQELQDSKTAAEQPLRLTTQFSIQGIDLTLQAGIEDLVIEKFTLSDHSEDFWVSDQSLPQMLPSHSQFGDAILLPKSWRESGALIGDQGYLFFKTPTVSSIQEQQIPIYVAGFFDPGILPMGGRVLLANPSIVSMIRSASPIDESPYSNGINVRFFDIADAENIKDALQNEFERLGISNYWQIQTFREFEFTKDFLQQLRSERNLFTLISMVIIIVACSNIVSMLIILVNDKKLEIGILRSMGATSLSIAAIFGICGVVMGLIGSVIGIALALLTLDNLQTLIDFISRVQGFEMFNPSFFGETLPNEISIEALTFVLTATALISLVAGVVPALKASLLRPSAILRSE